MARNRRTYAASSLVALALLAAIDGRALAEPRKKGVGKTVESNEITDGTITCDDISPSVFPNGCPGEQEAEEATGGAQNVFVDGFTTPDQELPSTPSAGDRAASIARLEVEEGSHVIFASIVWSGNPVDFTGIVTCLLIPPNGPTSKAEFQGTTTTTGTLFAQTTNSGAGIVDFRCTDSSPGSSVKYRFVQLTAIPVPSLTRTNLLP
jgi:hypothetical protein